MVSRRQIAEAMANSAKASDPRAIKAWFESDRDRLVIVFEGDIEISLPVALLGLPSSTDFAEVRVEGGGFDLYFPRADEGLFVPDLLRLAFFNASSR